MIVVGASLGGALALQELLLPLPADFPVPIAVVLHRHRDSETALPELIQRNIALRVRDALDKQPIAPGVVTLAPADYHLLIDGDHFSLSVDDPVRFARPSIDVLFESAAESARNITAVVLTGGGADGAAGAAKIENAGGRVFVQEPGEAMNPEMPLSAIAATNDAQVLPLSAIAARLLAMTM